MSFVDTVPADATGTPPAARCPDATTAAPARPHEAFASILADTFQSFQSSARLDQLLARRADPIRSLYDRQQRTDEALARMVSDAPRSSGRLPSADRSTARDDSGQRRPDASSAVRRMDDRCDDTEPATRSRDERSRTQDSDPKKTADRPAERARAQTESAEVPAQQNRSAPTAKAENATAGQRPDALDTARPLPNHPEGPPQPAGTAPLEPAGASLSDAHNPAVAATVAGRAGGAAHSVAASGALRVAPTGAPGSLDSARAVQVARGLAPAVRPASAPSDFLNGLQQAARARHTGTPATVRTAGVPGPATSERTLDLQRAESVQELARVLRSTVGGKHSSMTLRLDPPELGQVRIDVQMHEQALSIRIEADTKAGHDMLRARLGELRHSLESQGVRLDQLDVQVRQPAPTDDPRGHDGAAFAWREQGGDGGQQQVGDGSAFQGQREGAQQPSDGSALTGGASGQPAATEAQVSLDNDGDRLWPTAVDVTV